MAVDAWTAVPGLEGEAEPLIDCSVGGDGDGDEGELRVWAPQGWALRKGSPDGVGPRLVDPRLLVGFRGLAPEGGL